METVKEILLATARLAVATDARLDRLSEKQDRTQEQLDSLREDESASRIQLIIP